MVNINKKAKVISFPNEYMKESFSPYIERLGKKAKGDHDVRVQFAYLLKALDFMQYVDFTNLPRSSDEPFYQELEIDIEGRVYSQSFELIKPLNKENIFELRINLEQSNWRFRGIFFPYNFKSNPFYCFVFPFEKKPQIRDLTNQYRDRAHNIYFNLKQNQERYARYFN